MKRIYLLLMLIFILSCDNSSNEMSTKLALDNFNYSDELKSTMKILSEKTPLCNYDVERVVVRSNKFVVTNKYIMPFLYFELLKYSTPISDYSKEDIEGFFYFTANQRATNYAIYLEAKQNNIEVSKDEINDKLEEIAGNHIEEFKDKMSKSSIKFEFVIEDIVQVMTVEKYKESKIINDVKISDDEIKNYYNSNPSIYMINPKVTLRHILFKTEGLNDLEKQEKLLKIQNVLKLARGGKKFEFLAKEYSEDETSRKNGGRLGEFVELGKLPKEFEDVILSTKIGDISDIVESPYGFHILKVEDIKSKSKKNIEDVKDQIQKILLVEKKNAKIDQAIKDIYKKYRIEEIRG